MHIKTVWNPLWQKKLIEKSQRDVFSHIYSMFGVWMFCCTKIFTMYLYLKKKFIYKDFTWLADYMTLSRKIYCTQQNILFLYVRVYNGRVEVLDLLYYNTTTTLYVIQKDLLNFVFFSYIFPQIVLSASVCYSELCWVYIIYIKDIPKYRYEIIDQSI